MRSTENTIDELHALLIEYGKGLPKKVAIPQVLAIQCGRIQKPNKKSQAAKGEEVGKHGLGDLNKDVNYKVALLDPKSNKWFDAMNAKMQFMKDNQVWRLVDLPPNDIRAIRIPISIASSYDYEIWQIDIKATFLNGYLDEDI
uniref:Reverse transcriptase Ty1/copia-type domain-containing protein n=1 Tax=Tanacetum cinerariifolium TaxID=118510 RepID=A0A6L2JH54_TANCI|nr:hypothetical protein [Tanacetum cinerariifolium]